MGQVFLGRSGDRTAVALKVIRPDLADQPGFRDRFAREIEVAGRARGRFVAPLVDADTDGSPPWLATGYLAGPTLAEALDLCGPLPVGSVLELAAGLAEALTDLHAAGIVHRDLKPGNVILLDDGPRVIDFGISRASDMSTMTHTGELIGSPGFLAPEQVVGTGEVSPAGDVFALGALICFAVTGTGPFGRGQTAALMYRVVHEPPDLDRVPDELRGLVADCLAKRAADRPTAAEVLSRLDADREEARRPGHGWLPDAAMAEIADRRRALTRPVPDGTTEIRPRPAGPPPATSARRHRWSVVAAAVAGVVTTVAAVGYLSLPDADAGAAGTENAPPTVGTSSAPTVASTTPSAEQTSPAPPTIPSPPPGETTGAAEPEPSPGASSKRTFILYTDPSYALRQCLRTAVANSVDLRARVPHALATTYTSPACDRIHIKLGETFYPTHARACLRTPDGRSVTECSSWILLSSSDTWDTFSVPVKGRTAWELEMYSEGDQTVEFVHTA
jgi:serine/threonine protein kinase